jgi:hypothetical protein
VYPDGVPRTFSDEVAATAVRDRMNALLASMIHQHKRIVLHDLREAGDGAYAARVTVNEADLASDPVLRDLHGQHRAGSNSRALPSGRGRTTSAPGDRSRREPVEPSYSLVMVHTTADPGVV